MDPTRTDAPRFPPWAMMAAVAVVSAQIVRRLGVPVAAGRGPSGAA